MKKNKRRLTRPTSQEERRIIDIAAVGEGIAPLFDYYSWVSDPRKIPRNARRKFRKLWRAAEKWLGIDRAEPNWYRTFAKAQMASSYILEKMKKKS